MTEKTNSKIIFFATPNFIFQSPKTYEASSINARGILIRKFLPLTASVSGTIQNTTGISFKFCFASFDASMPGVRIISGFSLFIFE
ncbi:MAG: hypothetical protein CVU77_05125 [Elusimicrobia bacterium HGW-Elusimicrobia-1]|nr:MAG: hypothetical protein CVU77_05125 [Elusimicrobia bacterium HGW-Elusimicrobia-1]